MTEDFKPGTRVRVAADATYGWVEEPHMVRRVRDSGWGDGPWEGTVASGPDKDGDYWIGIRNGSGMYAHRDYVTALDEEAPEPAPTERPLSPRAALTALLQAITDAGYRVTEVEHDTADGHTAFTIRTDLA